MSGKAKCPAKVYPSEGFWRPPHQCGRNASYEHEGVMYCKTHHPPTVKAKGDERMKQFDKKFVERQERWFCASQAIAIKDEYGLTPRELVERNRQLSEALQRLYDAIDSCVDLTPEVLLQARAALANAERKTS